MSKSFLPQDFMERVVAWPGPDGPGYINLHWQAPDARGGQFRGRPFKELPDFMDLAQRAAIKPSVFKEIYFCLSTQKVTGKLVHGVPIAHRHASQAIALKALWIDVDVKPEKGYGTIDEAMLAITAFVVAANLPTPSAIVYSGGGVHVYWISDKPLTVDEWAPYAHGLRHEIQTHGLKCDAGLTTDSARVLRVPGTFNNKIQGKPRPVLLKWLGDSYDFGTHPAMVRLRTLAPVPAKKQVTVAVTVQTGSAPPFDLSAFPPGKMHPLLMGAVDPVNDTLASGLNLHADMPLDPAEVFAKCLHFQDSFLTHGKSQSQGLWMQTVLATTWFEDGRRIAHTLSKGYPKYDPAETDAMYDRKLKERTERDLGWPGCSAFEGEGAKCKQCPFYHKLRSPLNLAERVQPPAPVHIQPAVEEHALPEGYCLNTDGIICEIVPKTLKNGQVTEDERPLFMCQLRNFVLTSGDRGMQYETSLDRDHWGPASVTEADDLVSDQALIKALRRDGVKPCVPNQSRICNFMTSFMAKLDEAKERQRTIAFGWLYPPEDSKQEQKPIGFAYGGRVVMNDGSERVSGFTDKELESMYTPRGSADAWWQALHLLTEQHRPDLEVMVMSSLGAPLMKFTGERNCVMCGFSNKSGAHKSTAIAVGLSVWANPTLAKEKVSSSQKGTMRRLGHLRNLPVYWDEINKPEKMDEIVTQVGEFTEGGEGVKLHTDRTIYKMSQWQTNMLVGSNMSLVAAIIKSAKSTDASLQRTFEFEVQPKDKTPEQQHKVSLLIESLDHNYGHFGLLYSRYIATHYDEIKALVDDAMERFISDVGAQSPERFRKAVAVAAYVGGLVANKIGCNFNTNEVWDFLIQKFREQRNVIDDAELVGGTENNTVNALSQFFKASTFNALWIGKLPASRAGKPGAIVYIAGPTRERPNPIHVRLAVDDQIIEFSKTKFLDFLTHSGYENAPVVLDGLKRHLGATEHRVDLSAGTGVLGLREKVVRIPAPETSPFHSLLHRHPQLGTPAEPVTAPVTPVKFVKGPGEDQPAPKETGIAAAMAQANKDLDTVRKATS